MNTGARNHATRVNALGLKGFRSEDSSLRADSGSSARIGRDVSQRLDSRPMSSVLVQAVVGMQHSDCSHCEMKGRL